MRATRSYVFALAACAALTAVSAETTREPDSVLLVKGWVQAAGELRIYPSRKDLGHLYDGSCVSGVLSNGRTLPAHLQNQHVAAYGAWMSSDELSAMTVRGESIGVENYCGGPKIAIIAKLVPLSK